MYYWKLGKYSSLQGSKVELQNPVRYVRAGTVFTLKRPANPRDPDLFFFVTCTGEGDKGKARPCLGPLYLAKSAGMRTKACCVPGESKETCLSLPWHCMNKSISNEWKILPLRTGQPSRGFCSQNSHYLVQLVWKHFQLAVASGNWQKQVQILSVGIKIQPKLPKNWEKIPKKISSHSKIKEIKHQKEEPAESKLARCLDKHYQMLTLKYCV